MKILIKSVLSVLIVATMSGCNKQKPEYKNNIIKPKSTTVYNGASKYFSFSDNEIFRNVDIENLDSKQLKSNQIEMRLIIFGGLLSLTVFVYGNKNNVNQAYFVKFITTKDHSTPKKIRLPQPKSGWEKFDSYLFKNGIKSPLNWKPVKEPPASADQMFIILEIKKGDDYDFRLYSSSDKTDEYKKMYKIWYKIIREFQINDQ